MLKANLFKVRLTSNKMVRDVSKSCRTACPPASTKALAALPPGRVCGPDRSYFFAGALSSAMNRSMRCSSTGSGTEPMARMAS